MSDEAAEADLLLGSAACGDLGPVATGRVDEFDRPAVRSGVVVGVLGAVAVGRHPSGRAQACGARAEPGRARGGLQRSGRGRSLRAIASQLGRAPSTISREVGRNGGRDRYGRPIRAGGMGACAAPEALQAGLPSGLAPNSVGEAAPPMVARADRGLAGAQLCGPRAAAGVTRDDLQEPLYPGARRAEEGTARASAGEAHDPPLAPRQPEA